MSAGSKKHGLERFNFWTIVVLITLIFALLFIAYPFSRMLIQSFQSKDQAFTMKNYIRFFEKRYYYNTLLNSFKVCFAATAIATLLGVPMAYIGTRFNIWCKRLINIAIVISLLSPPFIGAYSWIMLLGRNGFLTNLLRTFGIETGSIYGFKGILLVFTLKLYPYVYMYVSAALGSIDASLEEASENLGISGIQRLMKVTFPLVLPTILSSALMVFMTALADYGTPLMIGEGYKVLPVVIYEEYLGEVGGSVTFASALSVIVVLCSTTVLFIQKRVVDKRNYNMSMLRPPAVKKLSGGKRLLATGFVGTVAFLGVLPQITVVVTSFLKMNGPMFTKGFSLNSYKIAMAKMSRNITNTYVYAAIALVIMVVLGMLLSYIIVRNKTRMSGFLDFVMMFPYVIPGSVLGISLIVAFNKRPLLLTGTAAIMIISYVIRKMPYTLRSSIGILYQIDTSVEEASVSLGYSQGATFFNITSRLMLPGVFSGAILSFIASINELSSSLMLYSGKTATISVAIFTEIFQDGYGTGAALASMLTLSTIVVLLIFNKVSGGKSVIS
jgi:iron(III) transport system permease protein